MIINKDKKEEVFRPLIKLKKISMLNREIFKEDTKVDIVYTWVNGSDPEFIEKLNKELKTEKYKHLYDNEYKKARYNDRDELKYSLRSVEKYFDWYNNIYIVTNGQIPNWLNTSNPRIKVVTHQEIFLNKNDLPTFSSVAIESNLHRIPGLSEDFIYLNDDIIFGSKIEKSDFFTPEGKHKIYTCWKSPRVKLIQSRDAFGNSMIFVNHLYDTMFGYTQRRVICHVPNYIKKSVLVDLHQTFPKEFERTSSNKFRAHEDMQFSFSYYHFLISKKQYWTVEVDPKDQLYYRGIGSIYKHKSFDKDSSFKSTMPKFMCFQDDVDGDDSLDIKNYFVTFFESKLTGRSQYEKV